MRRRHPEPHRQHAWLQKSTPRHCPSVGQDDRVRKRRVLCIERDRDARRCTRLVDREQSIGILRPHDRSSTTAAAIRRIYCMRSMLDANSSRDACANCSGRRRPSRTRFRGNGGAARSSPDALVLRVRTAAPQFHASRATASCGALSAVFADAWIRICAMIVDDACTLPASDKQTGGARAARGIRDPAVEHGIDGLSQARQGLTMRWSERRTACAPLLR